MFISYIFHIVLHLRLLKCGRVYRLLSKWTGSPVTAITWFWSSDLQKTQHVRSVNRAAALMTFPSWNLVVISNTSIFYQSCETSVAEYLLPRLQPANWKIVSWTSLQKVLLHQLSKHWGHCLFRQIRGEKKMMLSPWRIWS